MYYDRVHRQKPMSGGIFALLPVENHVQLHSRFVTSRGSKARTWPDVSFRRWIERSSFNFCFIVLFSVPFFSL